MSTSPDPEVVELVLDFEGLSITVRGAPQAATNFVQGLQRGSARHSAASSAGCQSPPGTGARGIGCLSISEGRRNQGQHLGFFPCLSCCLDWPGKPGAGGLLKDTS